MQFIDCGIVPGHLVYTQSSHPTEISVLCTITWSSCVSFLHHLQGVFFPAHPSLNMNCFFPQTPCASFLSFLFLFLLSWSPTGCNNLCCNMFQIIYLLLCITKLTYLSWYPLQSTDHHRSDIPAAPCPPPTSRGQQCRNECNDAQQFTIKWNI